MREAVGAFGCHAMTFVDQMHSHTVSMEESVRGFGGTGGRVS